MRRPILEAPIAIEVEDRPIASLSRNALYQCIAFALTRPVDDPGRPRALEALEALYAADPADLPAETRREAMGRSRELALACVLRDLLLGLEAAGHASEAADVARATLLGVDDAAAEAGWAPDPNLGRWR